MSVKFDRFLYGGDYNPDQWLEYPQILEDDIRLMKQAHINTVSLGIFAWAKLEPEEGVYDFDWMEEIINRLYENGISVNLATPSGARPHWMADRYPEVLRVNETRQRELFGTRHNHCYTSPVYREKVRKLNQKLAERFDDHPGVILWHVSNEYTGECHCPLCQQAFRDWVKDRYHTIEEVNRRWNTSFWSHDYQSFDQIESPSSIGENSIQGLYLDWRRFVSHQTTDFCRAEVAALREAGAKKPVTTNMFYNNPFVNYYELADAVDIVSWDSYPFWHKGPESQTAVNAGMQHDVMRAMKREPFLLMESCPGPTNWVPVSKLKRPGMLETASLQAIAHGSDSVLYFQIRKGRGGFEKLHGAVIDHYGKEDDRTYQECCQVGADLEAMQRLNHSKVEASVAVIYDWENRWAVEASAGPRNENMYYREAVEKSYSAFRRQGVNVDVIDMTKSLEPYQVVAAPVVYMFRAGFEEKVRAFVERGGVFIMTYWTGVVDENDLCFLGGTPGGLMDVMGLRSTEIDALYEGESNTLRVVNSGVSDEDESDVRCSPNAGSFGGDRSDAMNAHDSAMFGGDKSNVWDSLDSNVTYSCEHLCQLVDLRTAEPLFVYGEDFYAGTPALTVNHYGEGLAYYVCADAEQGFYDDVYARILKEAGVPRILEQEIPDGVAVSSRRGENTEYIFVQNFNPTSAAFCPEVDGSEVIFGEAGDEMKPFSTVVLERKL
ncbi:MAG: beta-galactosidase [Lachnospiraceae bacterium]|nr:beta-galactosidase [Lachnospiraceae bacterium]